MKKRLAKKIVRAISYFGAEHPYEPTPPFLKARERAARARLYPPGSLLRIPRWPLIRLIEDQRLEDIGDLQDAKFWPTFERMVSKTREGDAAFLKKTAAEFGVKS